MITTFFAAMLLLNVAPNVHANECGVSLERLPIQDQQQKDALEAALRVSLSERAASARWTNNYSIIDASGSDNWALLHVLFGQNYATDAIWIFPAEKTGDSWHVYVPGSLDALRILSTVPERYNPMVAFGADHWRFTTPNFLTEENHSQENGSAATLPLPVNQYRLPYPNGTTVYVSQDSAAHGGPVDFVGQSGKTIVAAANGTVQEVIDINNECCCSMNCNPCENRIVIAHDNNEWTIYRHIARGSHKVNVGAYVSAGTPLATEGDVGFTCSDFAGSRPPVSCGGTAPGTKNCAQHLHFELRSGGKTGPYLQPAFCNVGNVASTKTYTASACAGGITTIVATDLNGVPVRYCPLQLDSQSVGSTDQNGRLSLPSLICGNHRVRAVLGYLFFDAIVNFICQNANGDIVAELQTEVLDPATLDATSSADVELESTASCSSLSPANGFAVGDVVEVFGTGNGLRARYPNPCTDSYAVMPDGSVGTIIGSWQCCNGYIRWKIRYDDLTGIDVWSAEGEPSTGQKFLRKVGGDGNVVLEYVSNVIHDGSGGGVGNSNGQVNPGEEIDLDVVLRNRGAVSATNVSATISSTSSYVDITDNDVSFPDISDGGTATGSDFDFTVSQGAPSGHTIPFTLQISSDQGNFTEHFTVTVSGGGGGSADLSYAGSAVHDGTGGGVGNSDEVINPGEEIDLDVDLRNDGSATATNVSAVLSTSSPYISITDNDVFFPDISPGDTITGSDFDFTVSDAAPSGHVIAFTLEISSDQGTSTRNFTLTVFGGASPTPTPTPTATATAGPSATPTATATATATPALPVQLGNIATRLQVGTGDNAMIGGFIITGTHTKTVVVRGIGPSLPLPGALADPVIEVYDGGGVLRGTNDNWNDALTRQEIIDSGLAPTNDLESALWGVINPGAYTVVVRGKNNGTGVGLFEVYDVDQTVDSKLANISTRGFVDTGDNVMIGGTIITGSAPAKILVRAIGPSLSAFGVAHALQDPTLELRDVNGALIASNDDWRATQETEIIETTIPPTDDRESAILQTLSPGPYTAIVRGFDNSTGVALVEAYQLP